MLENTHTRVDTYTGSHTHTPQTLRASPSAEPAMLILVWHYGTTGPPRFSPHFRSSTQINVSDPPYPVVGIGTPTRNGLLDFSAKIKIGVLTP